MVLCLHVRRRDLLAQVVTQAACCVYWFHPLAWLAAREQRRQRERACDDAVLRQGISPADYAGHLVDLVRGLTIEAPAMAEASDFEGRVRDLPDRSRNRAPLSRGLTLAVSALAVALILPVACAIGAWRAGGYEIQVRIPGFNITHIEVVVAAGVATRDRSGWDLGEVFGSGQGEGFARAFAGAGRGGVESLDWFNDVLSRTPGHSSAGLPQKTGGFSC